MDKDKIFKLFNDNNEEEKTVELEDKLSHSSTIKVGMFAKLILNHKAFHVKLDKFLKSEEPSYNIESTKESSEYIVYNRAWFYIEQVDLEKKEDIFAILDFNNEILNNALESAILYFETSEEYLKCAHIFKIQQILRESKR